MGREAVPATFSGEPALSRPLLRKACRRSRHRALAVHALPRQQPPTIRLGVRPPPISAEEPGVDTNLKKPREFRGFVSMLHGGTCATTDLGTPRALYAPFGQPDTPPPKTSGTKWVPGRRERGRHCCWHHQEAVGGQCVEASRPGDSTGRVWETRALRCAATSDWIRNLKKSRECRGFVSTGAGKGGGWDRDGKLSEGRASPQMARGTRRPGLIDSELRCAAIGDWIRNLEKPREMARFRIHQVQKCCSRSHGTERPTPACRNLSPCGLAPLAALGMAEARSHWQPGCHRTVPPSQPSSGVRRWSRRAAHPP